MFELLKALFRRRDRSLIVMVVDPDEFVSPVEYSLDSKRQKRWFTALFTVIGIAFAVVIMLVILRWTAGGDARLKAELVALNERLATLSDSVSARDRQLTDIRNTMLGIRSNGSSISNGNSTSNQELPQRESNQDTGSTSSVVLSAEWSNNQTYSFRPLHEQIAENSLRGTNFPANLPVLGRLTRTYLPNLGHYGIDIAVREGTVVRSIGDGRVIGADWTLSFGYVVTIMHSDGYVVVFKHLTETDLQTGNLIVKGDTIGRVGMAGSLSSGPHLHIELWKDGSVLDPMLYFIE